MSNGLGGWFGEAWSTLTNSWSSGPSSTPDGTSWSLYDVNDSSSAHALAAKFMVKNVPSSGNYDLYWALLLADRDAALINVQAAQYVHGNVPGSELPKAERYVQSMVDDNASGWLDQIQNGFSEVQMPWGGDMTNYILVLMTYAYKCVEDGMYLQEPSAVAEMINSGRMTANEISRDYMLRRGVLQAITKICNTKPVSDLLFQRPGTSGLGVAPIVIGAVALVVVAVALVAAFAFMAVSLFSIKKANELKVKQLDNCATAFAKTGVESPGCNELYKGAAASGDITLPGAWADKAVLYGAIIVGGGLLIYFLPIVVEKVGLATARARAQRSPA
jgi:hypothetical protein